MTDDSSDLLPCKTTSQPHTTQIPAAHSNQTVAQRSPNQMVYHVVNYHHYHPAAKPVPDNFGDGEEIMRHEKTKAAVSHKPRLTEVARHGYLL